jgi:RNA polymerase-binding protein DksA
MQCLSGTAFAGFSLHYLLKRKAIHMISQQISPQQSTHFRERLRDLRDRMNGQVESAVEAIREDLNPVGQVSNAPVHLADAAPENIESDIQVIETERGLLDEVQAALHRLDDGTFGRCEQCGGSIGEERLDAIPYASRCIRCAAAA